MQYHIKKGKRYVPVNDPLAYEGLEKGSWLVVVRPGSTSIRTMLNPKFAELDAALDCLREELTRAISEKSKIRPRITPLSTKEKKAWEAFDKAMGYDRPTYFAEFASYSEIAEKACDHIKKIILENNCDIDKIKKKFKKKTRKLQNSILELET